MPKPARTRMQPFDGISPMPIHFRYDVIRAASGYHAHQHDRGEFYYSFCGVMNIKTGAQHFLAPPQYGLWLPPGTAHECTSLHGTSFCALYIDAALVGHLPANPCALTIEPLVRALLEHLRGVPEHQLRNSETQRLLQVLLDQLAQAPCSGSYLPGSTHPVLAPLLQTLQANPADDRSLAELAQQAHISERTLMRYCRKELGMSLAEWRQRLRIIKAMGMLEAGDKVESIALDLGYASASSFIAMFRKATGTTPGELRQNA